MRENGMPPVRGFETWQILKYCVAPSSFLFEAVKTHKRDL
jgi:hypothetical protein